MKKRNNFAGGLILLLLGAFFLAWQIRPDLIPSADWPFIIIGFGLLFIIAAAFFSVGPLAIPGAIIAGIGGILFYQNLTNDWESWTYLWTLIPGFVGVGLLIAALFDHGVRRFRAGLNLLVMSVIGLAIFGGAFGFGGQWAKYWPGALILLGIWMLIRSFWHKSTE
jgi:hypothetical protein